MRKRARDSKGKFLSDGKVPNYLAQRKYYYKNQPLLLQKYREKNARLKKLVYDHYGNKCNCCGETRKTMLRIDHVNNDGYKDRAGRGSATNRLYAKIIKLGFPDDYQILCMNCNFSKKRNGGVCEHITEMYE